MFLNNWWYKKYHIRETHSVIILFLPLACVIFPWTIWVTPIKYNPVIIQTSQYKYISWNFIMILQKFLQGFIQKPFHELLEFLKGFMWKEIPQKSTRNILMCSSKFYLSKRQAILLECLHVLLRKFYWIWLWISPVILSGFHSGTFLCTTLQR